MSYKFAPLKLCSVVLKLPIYKRILDPSFVNNVEKQHIPARLVLQRWTHVLNVSDSEKSDENTAETDYYKNLDVSSITSNDPVLEKKLKILFLEVEVLRQSGSKVPSLEVMKLDHWNELLKLDTRSGRRRYLEFLFKNQMSRENRKQKKENRRKQWEEELEKEALKVPDDSGHIQYGLGKNSIFLRVYDTTINNFYHGRLMQAMQFNQKVVLDCGYDTYMNSQEAKNCAKQLTILFSDNRVHDNPFDVYFCNAARESITMKQLVKYIPTMYNDDFPLNITERSYLDIFPKENIVYLTPHCREELTEFDHDAVYVIGAMVDKQNCEPLSLAKAKRENLKMAKFPLDKYLLWGSGASKSLTINQVLRILLELHTTNDWNEALKVVPRRKLMSDSELREGVSQKIGKIRQFPRNKFKIK